ncbi:MAG: filamentous hemagglutinin N-terminal domain-containing protein [Candidatus Omnitrophota bacterium]
MNRVKVLNKICLVLALSSFILISVMGVCLSLPEPDEVVAGQAEFQYPNPTTLQINAQDKTIINYKSFDIMENESVIVNLPSVDSEILNRVLSDKTSQILGNLTCNGTFLLVNESGVNFGPRANVDAGSLVVSTRDITDANFLDSEYVFEKLSKERLDGLLLNEGKITIRTGGFGIFIAAAIENRGTIIASVGRVVLAGGDMVSLDISGDNSISVVIDKEAASGILDNEGNPVTSQIKNTGTIQADGGSVLLKAENLNRVFRTAINLDGYIKANKVVEKNGVVSIISSDDIVSVAQISADKIEIGRQDEAIPQNVAVEAGKLESASGGTTILAKNDLITKADITSQDGDIKLFADYDGDNSGKFSQLGGTIYAMGKGNVYIDGSQEMTLGKIATDSGFIKIGSERAPVVISGNPDYVHSEIGFDITEKEETLDMVTLKTATGDILRYNSSGSLTLEAQKGNISDLTSTPLTANSLSLSAQSFLINSLAFAIEIYKTVGNIEITNVELKDTIAILEGKDINVTYLKDGSLTLRSDQAVSALPTVAIQASRVKIIAKEIGSLNSPVTINAGITCVSRTQGDIEISGSAGLGTSILLRGPPDGFGAIVYNSDTNLTLEAQNGNILVAKDVAINAAVLTLKANNSIYSEGALLSSDSITLLSDGPISSLGSLQTKVLIERGASFKVGGIYNVDSAAIQNADDAITLSTCSFSGALADIANIILDANAVITLTGAAIFHADSDVNGTGAFIMNLGSSIIGGGYNLTIYASEASTLRSITNVGTLTIAESKAGSAPTYTTYNDITTSNLIVDSGTLSGAANITVSGGNVTGNGTINLAGGTFIIDGTGNFGGNTDWTFYNLTFGDGVEDAVTSKAGSNSITVINALQINIYQMLQAGSIAWNITWGVSKLADISQIVAGGHHTVALRSDGLRVYAWGNNIYGQLGNNSIADSKTPVEVLGVGGIGYLTGVLQIAAGDYHTVALKSDGSVYTWGSNGYGQLGNNFASVYSLTPVAVVGVGAEGYLTGVSQISAGVYHTVALKSDGSRVYAWGSNAYGQLGNNSASVYSLTPVAVVGVGAEGYLTGVSQISAGAYYTVALKSDGLVCTWGSNAYGQLGNNSTTDSRIPVEVVGIDGTGYLTGISQISAGYFHTVALKSDGSRVYAWGSNAYGQLGNNSTVASKIPVQVIGVGAEGYLTGISQISAGAYHTVALKSDGSRVYAWGYNFLGQLGNNSKVDSLTPVEVIGVGATDYLTGISQIAAGGFHTAALKSDGSRVYAWGYNLFGQLGNNSKVDSYIPVEVFSRVEALGYLTDISQISAGGFHTVALKSDGTVYAWGNNVYGQLGDNSNINSLTPVKVKGVGAVGYLTDISKIAVGDIHTVALKSDGTVYTWGSNYYCQLGNNSRVDSKTPIVVTGLSGISQIAAGYCHTVALKGSDGTVYTWGYNYYGQLGNPYTIYGKGLAYTPIRVLDVNPTSLTDYLTGISQIAAGYFHTVALKSDGSRVYAWGYNAYGQLGKPSVALAYTPVEVVGIDGTGYLTDISQIAAGDYHTVALKSDGSRVYAWGLNYYGQLGNNSATDSRVPVEVLGVGATGYLTDISQIAAGQYHTVALKSDGSRVYAWGSNAFGQLGNNSTTDSRVPVEVLGVGATGYLTDISQIASGYYHTAALKKDGSRVYVMGNSSYGQLGNNSTTSSPVPVEAVGATVSATTYLTGISQIVAGYFHTVALKSDGSRVYAWGSNYYGQLGNNSNVDSLTPVEVLGVGGVNYLTGISRISAGYFHTVALKSDGTVYAWGSNYYGQLGNNSTTDSRVPVEILGVGGVNYLTDISQIAAGGFHTVALNTDGTVYAWGSNYYGQLGNNSTTDSKVPVQVLGVGATGYLTGISQISAGYFHTVALKSDGSRVYAWGSNYYGQLGNNSTTDSRAPVEVLGVGATGYLTGISQIAAGGFHTAALKSDGSRVYAWGYNFFGQLGNFSRTNSSIPVEVLTGLFGTGYLTGISQIAAGGFHTAALKSDGSKVYAWGYNFFGQLGNNARTEYFTAGEVLGVSGTGYLPNMLRIAAGCYYVMVTDGSRVYTWGGHLGVVYRIGSGTPIQIIGVGGTGFFTGIAQMTDNSFYIIALRVIPSREAVQAVVAQEAKLSGNNEPVTIGFNYAVLYKEEGRFIKAYVVGKYRTVVIVFEGRVAVVPYDESGLRLDEKLILTTGGKISQEGEVKKKNSE